MGTNPEDFFWVAWKGKVWLFFKAGRWDFKNYSRNYFFGGVGWGVFGKSGWEWFFFLVFFSFVIW
jgi:hypothetical protein